MQRSLERFIEVVRARSLESRFAPGATPDELARFRREIALPVPDEFLEFFGHFNGTARPVWNDALKEFDGEECTLFDESTLRLLSLDFMLQGKQDWDEYSREYEDATAEQRSEWSRAHGFWNRAWIPFAENDNEVLALATAPCFGGPANQVLWFSYKGCDSWIVLSQSFGDWILTAAESLLAGVNSDAIQREHNPDWRYIELAEGDASPSRFLPRGTLFPR